MNSPLELLTLFQDWELVRSISYNMVINVPRNPPYILLDHFSAMRSGGEPQWTTKLPKFYKQDNIESDVHAIFIENTVFTVLSGRIPNPVVSVWYYHMPFSIMLKHKY